MDSLTQLEKRIGYKFKNQALLLEAITHSSYGWVDETNVRIDNEKLEFIGDAFLDAVVGTEIFIKMPKDSREGDLTKKRAQVVCESSLATVGKKLDLGHYLRLGPGEEKTGGRNKESLIADAVEAIIGAIYIDGGFNASSGFVLRSFRKLIDEAIEGRLISDYKTELQEFVHKNGGRIRYVVDHTVGPDHDKTFYVNLEINGEIVSEGVGKSKKEAQQNAAQIIIERGLDNVF